MKAEHLLERAIAGYRLLEFVGRGGMGVVFLAQSLENPEQKVAIKILASNDAALLGELASFKARFQREALAAHQLSHEHILSVLAYGEEDNLYYMVMPILTGGTLADRLSAAPEGLPLEQVARYLRQLAGAIDYAHQHGMVHRDIKPSNVLLDEEDNAYLADFGIVHVFDSTQQVFDEDLTTLTTVGKIYGTPAYMAPERYKGQQAEPATDIYALGILLYQLVTGQLPFDADNPLALGMKHLNEEPAAPRLMRPDLPMPAEAAMFKAIAKEPEDRFTSASALADAFERGLQGDQAAILPPVAEMGAAYLADETLKRPAAVAAPMEEIQQVPLVLSQEPIQQAPLVLSQEPDMVGSVLPLALAQTVGDAPAVERVSAPARSRLQFIALGLLGVTLLLFIGLLAFAAVRFLHPAQAAPELQPISTSAAPAELSVTPAASTGTTPAAQHSPASTGTAAPTSSPNTGTPGTTPTANSGSGPGATPTTVPTSQPTQPTSPSPTAPAPTATSGATPGATPAATPTAQGTP